MFRRLALACLAALCLANCSTAIDGACVSPASCACPDGSKSVQPCRDDGTLGACDCAPNRTCATNADCPVNATCASGGAGPRSCSCTAGFEAETPSGACKDIDECLTENGGCHRLALCANVAGGRECSCPDANVGDGLSCKVAPCTDKPAICNRNATCTKGQNGDACVCKAGYSGDGAFCDPYPPSPYGTKVGTVIKDIVLNGYLEPSSAEASWGPVRLDQFYDSRGDLGPDGGPLKGLLVMVGSAACPNCKAAAPSERDLCQQVRADGLVCMTVLQRGVNNTASTQADADFWISTYQIDFPVVIDPGGIWTSYMGGLEEYPALVLVDTQSMQIVAIRSDTAELSPTLNQLLGTSL